MPAPNYEDLYKFSEAFESAGESIIEEGGIEAGKTFKQRGKEILPATRIDLQFSLGGQLGSYCRTHDGDLVANAWNGNLRIQILADRKKAPTFIEETKAKIRALFAAWKNRFNTTNLPYYTVVSFKETGTAPTIEADDNRDVCTITYALVFNIRKDAWPLPTPPIGLEGLQWVIPCTGGVEFYATLCTAVDPEDGISTMKGRKDTLYAVGLHIRGLCELVGTEGGAASDSFVLINGQPDANPGGYNVYSLEVSDPPMSYILNRNYDGRAQNGLTLLDYTFGIVIRGGATVTLRARTVDLQQFKNVGDQTIPEIENPAQPYDGQFMQMDVQSLAIA